MSGGLPLAGRTALVTGARTGIGRASALALAAAGADLVCWDRATSGDVPDQARALGRAAESVVSDLTDADRAADELDALLARRRIDILVNNAGTIHREPAEQTSMPDWRRVLTLNLDAVFAMSVAVGRQMLANGDGRIITIASLLSFQGGVTVPAYAASKHGIVGLTRALANEWAGRGVNVNAVAPGYVVTENTAPLRRDPDRQRAISERIPAGRWGTPEDIAGPVVFLAGPDSRYVHGHVLVVDGGWMGR
ncbi:SDR family oxidoreductase [Phytohabitans sp. ZYX-F-186]|uniref:SDR family oxidoreductase n=1 Tax=Phytohabitans maris TaxID=3071409 RepID=A0ABU0ZCK2_9ACTN|nr:SDR family oxidoreductase [Phytohabitans sp. ZYX-F-186]MDQ7904786.1 SDR family oxidoreductase [Phytohabitans sp. ZYX-F-186]